MAMITEAEDFFTRGCGRCARFDSPDCAAWRWRAGLLALRDLCLGMGLSEAVRWAHPTYRHAGRNIALLGAMRGEFRLNFMDAGLLDDNAGLLERQGPNCAVPGSLRFTDAERVAALAPAIRDFLRQLMDHAEAGRKPPAHPPAAALTEMPEELQAALEGDPALAAAFAALTPGRQRSYLLALNGARQSATRHARIVRFRPRILAGKGATER